MESIISSIVFMALALLVHLFAPSNASAQMKPPIICCLNSLSPPDAPTGIKIPGTCMPSESHGFTADSMYPTCSINPTMLSSSNVFESNGSVQYSSSPAIPVAGRKDAYGFFVNDRMIFLDWSLVQSCDALMNKFELSAETLC
jgi:hypothetical protein